MLHTDFIEKMARYKPWYEYQPSSEGMDTTNKAVAKKFNVLPVVASAGVKFYSRHKDEPQRAEFGGMTHKSVVDASHFLKISDMGELRKELIKKFGCEIGDKMRPYPKFVSRRLIRLILKNSGLEWFEKNNRPFVHWKHCV